MILYHIEKEKYKDVWPPQGSLFAEGRWNNIGEWLIYTSPTISLAKLETLANALALPTRHVCMKIEVSDHSKIMEIELQDLPQDWMKKPYPSEPLLFTKLFLDSSCLILKVPSAQSYSESNYLINVRHPDFQKMVKLLSVEFEPFDPRLKR